jgi:telomerase protein component 1
MALYCRQELNIRQTANLLLAFSAWHPPCRPYLQRYFSASVRLPTDWMGVADMVMTFEGVAAGSLPAALRRAMVDKFSEFDEYQLAKHNRDKSGVMVSQETSRLNCWT